MPMLQEKQVNGVDVEQLFNTIEQIKGDTALASFQFRAQNRWIGGTHSRATVQNFYGAKHEEDSRAPMTFDLDEPPLLCGKDLGANPVEYLLVALSGCLTTSMIAHASAEGIEIKNVESCFEGDIDLRGFLGLSEDVPVGFQEIRAYFKIEADVPEEKKKELLEMGKKYSPVFNTIFNRTSVAVELEK